MSRQRIVPRIEMRSVAKNVDTNAGFIASGNRSKLRRSVATGV